MKKLLATVTLFVGLTASVPPAMAKAPFHHSSGPRFGHFRHGGHHHSGLGWFLPGLIIGGAIGWAFSPHYRYYEPDFPPAYEPPPTYYYPPPPPAYYPPAVGTISPYGPPSLSSNNRIEPAPYSNYSQPSPFQRHWIPGHCASYSPRPGVTVEECYQGRWE